jgi:hypothetical protein
MKDFQLANLVFLLTVFQLIPGGCVATPPPLSPENRSRLEYICKVPVSSTPRLEFHSFAKGWKAGAAKVGAFGLVVSINQSLPE